MSGIWIPNTSINSDINQPSFILKETASNSTSDQIGNTQSASTSNSQNHSIYSLLSQSLVELEKLKKEMEVLKDKQDKQDELLNSIQKLSDITHLVVLVLCIIPIIQVVVSGVLIYILGMQDKLNGLLNFTLTCLFGISAVELIGGFLKVYGLNKRIDNLEGKIKEKMKEK